MTFFVSEGAQLVIWLVFVFWEPFMPGRKDINWYKQWRIKVPWLLSPPSWVFPPVWFCLKLMVTASIFLYFKVLAEQNPVPTDKWQYLTVYILVLVNILMAKMWSPLFFRARMIGVALVNAFWIWATALAVVIVMGLSRDILTPDIWFVPVILYVFYVAWLTYAFFINLSWVRTFETAADGSFKLKVSAKTKAPGIFGFKVHVPGLFNGLMSAEKSHHHHHGKIHHKSVPSVSDVEKRFDETPERNLFDFNERPIQ